MGIGLSCSGFGVKSNIDLCFDAESPYASMASKVVVTYCAHTFAGMAMQADDAVDTLSNFTRLWVVEMGKRYEAYGSIAHD